MSAQAAERRLAAILSADVAGYSRLMAEDEQGTIQLPDPYRGTIGTLIEHDHRSAVVHQQRGRLGATPWL